MTRILVTGHTGFIGRAVVADLKARGHRVIGATRSTGCDLEQPGALAGLEQPDLIIHLAGKAGVLEGWRDPAASHRGNLLPGLCVLDQARLWQSPVILLSSYMYGSPTYNPVDEAHPLACNNPYAHAKRLVEMLGESYHRDFGLAVTLVRPFNLYGPGQGTDGLIGLIAAQMAGDAPEIRLNDLRPKRDWLHVADLARALALLAERPPEGLAVYNLGSGISRSPAEVVAAFQAAAGTAKPVVDLGIHRPNEIMDCRADCRRFKADYGWEPEISPEAGLAGLLG
jgi:nucleoside-diphosphate-sugar epimerase